MESNYQTIGIFDRVENQRYADFVQHLSSGLHPGWERSYSPLYFGSFAKSWDTIKVNFEVKIAYLLVVTLQ